MGVDMYLEGEKYILTDWDDASKNPMEDGYELKSKILRLGYWRKHPNLHGYIVQNFAAGVDNCEKIDLSIENLQQILSAVEADELPHTEGFFFGQSLPDDKDPTIEILKGAIQWLSIEDLTLGGGRVSKSVYYQASW